jgi:hypothetical protein
MIGCECKLEKDVIWKVVEVCDYCLAWDKSLREKTLDPLKEYTDGRIAHEARKSEAESAGT